MFYRSANLDLQIYNIFIPVSIYNVCVGRGADKKKDQTFFFFPPLARTALEQGDSAPVLLALNYLIDL